MQYLRIYKYFDHNYEIITIVFVLICSRFYFCDGSGLQKSKDNLIQSDTWCFKLKSVWWRNYTSIKTSAQFSTSAGTKNKKKTEKSAKKQEEKSRFAPQD